MQGSGWRERDRRAKREVLVVYLAQKDRRVPWYARLCAIALVVYAFSPVDPIPDFIPVLGYLDELVLLPVGIVLLRRMLPSEVLDEYRERVDGGASLSLAERRAFAVAIACAWVIVLTVILVASWRMLS